LTHSEWMGIRPGKSGEGPDGDEAEERWRLLGKVLAARAPELLEQTASMLEHVVAVMADRSEADPEPDVFVVV
jgi:hypothetical protein